MKRKTVFLVMAICAMVLFSATSTFAAGTPAGTVITNTATMNYKDLSGTAFTPITATVNVTVEQLAGVTLTPGNGLQYSSDSMYVYFPMTVTNTGNGKDKYTLASADSASWTPTIFFDANGDGVLQGSETTTLTASDSVSADATYKIIVRLFVPFGTVSGRLDTIRTTATSQFTGPDPIVWTFAKDSIRTRMADIGVTKNNNNGTPQPGQTITYTVNYSNTGTGTGQGAYLADTLDANVTYTASSAVVNSGGGTVAFLTSPNRIVWSNIGNAGSVYGGAAGQMTFSVTVNANVPSTTVISNHAYMVYTDSINGHTEKPKGGPTTSTVAQLASWNLQVATIGPAFSTNNASDSVNVSQSIYFKVKLTNTGNKTDTATIARTTSIPLTWTLFKDANRNGVFDGVGTDPVFDLAGNTGAVAQGDSIMFIAVDTVLQGVADRSRDSANYHAVSLSVGANASGYTITRVKAPVMQLSKSVAGISGRTRPGDTLVYTITYTNVGSGDANSIVISDASPTNTTYIGSSVQLKNSANGNVFTAKTDGTDADEIVVSGGTITATLGTVGNRLNNVASYTGQIKFKVKIN